MAAFSSNEQQSLERAVECDSFTLTAVENLRDSYELDRCEEWIKNNAISKVCLQFPDHLLGDSPDIALAIEKNVGCECFILADTSYGSCCVDEVSAEHVNAGGIIHFGHACLSPTKRLPVLYIFHRKPFEVSDLVTAISSKFEDFNSRLLIIYDVAYCHKIGEVQEKLLALYPYAVSALPALNSTRDSTVRCLGCTYALPSSSSLQDYKFLYVGNDGRTFTNYLLELSECTAFLYNPEECQKGIQYVDGKLSRFLMKRLHLVERVKDASTLGILIGTLGVSGYLDAVDRIKKLAKATGKKTYIIAAGRPNVAKLANFPEIDVFVLVACPENSLLDWKEYYQPIVSLYEVELACNTARTWSSKYVLDFRQLLADGSDHVEISEGNSSDQDVSLITGKMRSMVACQDSSEESQLDVALRPDLPVILATGSQYLTSRSWKGLDPKLGETPVEMAQPGRCGTASRYSSEPAQ